MVKSLGSHIVNAEHKDFLRFTGEPSSFTGTFKLIDKFSVHFDTAQGGSVTASSIQPPIGSPFIRISPVDMGAASWYSLEYPIDGTDLQDLGQVIATFDAATPQSATIFAVLRLVQPDKKFSDTSSTQVELRRDRKNYSFPIGLDEVTQDAIKTAEQARLIFFIEARDVDIDLFGLQVFGVPAAPASVDVAAIDNLRTVSKAPDNALGHVGLDVDAFGKKRKLRHRQEVATDMNFDVDSGKRQHVIAIKNGAEVHFDFAKAPNTRWRTFEFVFNKVTNTGSITALINLDGDAAGQDIELNCVVRQYSDVAGEWTDTRVLAKLPVSQTPNQTSVSVDLSRVFPDTKHDHNIGILLFIPVDCAALNLKTLEAFVYDKRAQRPA
jgi:hypothetical protein